ncbi:DUF3883 domain-containing protein [Brevibacillus porteri]|uniref:DUF3883 domain-containing protein n=1 Tax=Brevibacillus porteri TaxID=2126350 RepID=UPI003D21A478
MVSYAVITENDESKWADLTGLEYHFPVKFKSKLIQGTKVIYYKGRITDKKYKSMRLSDNPHYFGMATIGEVRQSMDNPNEYFAQIEDYIPFKEHINFKDDNGNYYEDANRSNYWRDGVRRISEDIYVRISMLANFDINYQPGTPTSNLNVLINDDSLVSIDDVNPELSDQLIRENKRINTDQIDPKDNRNNNTPPTFSRNSKKIGDRAEEIVLKLLREKGMSNIRWLANEGQKPGYDISCNNNAGDEFFIEVKGTTTSKFLDFIITNNEMKTLERLGDKYYLYFVAECLSKNPKIQIVQNPYTKILSNNWTMSPIAYKVAIL